MILKILDLMITVNEDELKEDGIVLRLLYLYERLKSLRIAKESVYNVSKDFYSFFVPLHCSNSFAT